MLIKFEPLVSQLSHARKPSVISATAPMAEDFPNGQKGISRLPPVSPLMYSTTEAKLPIQTPCKTFGISASATMPKDLPQWAERNPKIAALRFSPKVGRLDLSLPHRLTGAITDSAPKLQCAPCPFRPKSRKNATPHRKCITPAPSIRNNFVPEMKLKKIIL